MFVFYFEKPWVDVHGAAKVQAVYSLWPQLQQLIN